MNIALNVIAMASKTNISRNKKSPNYQLVEALSGGGCILQRTSLH